MNRMGTPGQEQARKLSLQCYQVLDTEAEAPFDELTQLATRLLGVSTALVGFLDEPRWWFKSRVGFSLEQLPLEQSFCREMLSTGQMLTVDDASIDPRFARHPLVLDGPQIRAYAGVPLINDEGHLLGSLCALDPSPRQWLETDRAQLRLLADLVMARLELRRRQIELEATHQRLGHKERSWAACEQQLNQLARWMPTAIYQFRLSLPGVGSFPFASHAFQDLFGLSPEVLKADAAPFFEQLHADDREAMKQSVQVCEKTLAPWSMEFRCHLPDGRLEWFQGKSRPTMEPDGSVLWHGLFIRISDRRRAEQELREAEARWKFALEGSAAGVWDWNIESNEHYFSPQYRALYGYGEAETLPGGDPDAWVHPEDLPAHQAARQQHFDGLAPLFRSEHRARCQDGQWKWILSRGLVVARDAQGHPLRMIGTHTDITERKLSDEDNFRRAYYDPLTSLPNRALMVAKLFEWLQACPPEGSGAVIHVDLDGFKRLNHARGHGQGDVLLRSVARRLNESLGPDAILARLGADEFVVLLPRLPRSTELLPWQEALAVAEQLRVALLQPLPLGEQSFSVTASLGVTVCPQLDQGAYPDAEDVLRQADAAMNHAKATGANRVALFEPGMQTEIEKRFSIEEDLKHALQGQQLSLHVQPQFSTGQVVIGAELLIRWQHPVRGAVSPAEFIPVAETSGLIVPLGEWVLEQAVQALLQLQAAGLAFPLSVNVSPRQFRQPDFVERVRALLQRSGAPADRLIFEITEGLLLERSDSVQSQMDELIALGIRFSIDDFGTGFSSLGYLKRLPIHEIKIDRSFIDGIPEDEGDVAIVRSVLLMARQFRLQVIAEGVENERQVAFLFAHGCDGLQGYHFARPTPLLPWLASCTRGEAQA